MIQKVLSQVGSCPNIIFSEIAVGQGVCADMLVVSRGVDESVIAYVNADMGHASSPFCRKEYQVPLPQPAFIDGNSYFILPPGGMREIQAVEFVDRHGQAAAVKSLMR